MKYSSLISSLLITRSFRHIHDHSLALFSPSRRHHRRNCNLPTPLAFHPLNPFWLCLAYFVSLSFIGFLLLIALPMRRRHSSSSIDHPSHLDLFFMSVSASTVSSMDAVEMESFSNSQLMVFTLLMLFGGEVFTSMLDLLFLNLINYYEQQANNDNNNPDNASNQQELLELGTMMAAKPIEIAPEELTPSGSGSLTATKDIAGSNRMSSMRISWYLVLGYLVLVHAVGCALMMAYFSLLPGSTRAMLVQKGIRLDLFALFTTVSSFANCGFLPNNENMGLFRTYPGILMIVGTLVLLGNTLYPLALRAAVLALRRMMASKKEEFDEVITLRDDHEPNFLIMSGSESVMLGATVGALILVQVVLFCCMEWGSPGLGEMSAYQKVVGSLFMSINARHAGESIVDLSAVSPAVLVLYTVMMYLPAYTTFLPAEKIGKGKKDAEGQGNREEESFAEKLIFSQLSYLSIFTIIICITERRQMSRDPLNFNVLNIVFEVISAYGNVGFSTGYSCKRRLKAEDQELCRDSMVGFSGKWTRGGKLVLIAIMIFGRLKKFNLNGGKAWILR